MSILTPMHLGQAFRKFHGKPIDDLTDYVRQFYPFAELQFSGGGKIYYHTGLYAGNQPILLFTGLYEKPDDVCEDPRAHHGKARTSHHRPR